MEYLRWILLVVGVIVVVAVYLRGRAKRQGRDYSPLDAANEVPTFSAREEDDAWRDGVGPVRVVHPRNTDADAEPVEPVVVDDSVQPQPVPWEEPPRAPAGTPSAEASDPPQQDDSRPAAPEQPEVEEEAPLRETPEREVSDDDVIVLYVVADRGQQLKGEQILSATIATRLEYGDMNIFHRRDGDNKILFSMANMQEPGWFDYEQMHELKTRGVSLFIQLGLCRDPVEALDEMLVCAHTLASMLNAKMCDPDRQLLNETVARSLREKARYYYDLKHGKTEHERS